MSRVDERLSAARAAIASAYLDAMPPAMLGQITLRDDQRRIVARAQRALTRDGGCLIAEDVGRGKTFVALALARRWTQPLVVAPATLRTTWRSAGERAERPCAFLSHEGMSRGQTPTTAYDGIIVDESHHFRNASTRRHSVLARLAASAPVILLSATPLHNSVRDLSAQLCLFLGERAVLMSSTELARFVIRGSGHMSADMPRVAPPEWVTTNANDESVLHEILDLPDPAMPIDSGHAGVLRTIGLVRAWASSRAALRSRIRARARVAAAIEQGAEEGRVPTRREVRAWAGAGEDVQLGFPLLLIDATPTRSELIEMRHALAAERSSMGRFLERLRETPDPDVDRVAALRRLREKHPTARIIAFSEYAATVSAFFSALKLDPGTGLITAREARIVTGRIPRDQMLTRFAPIAQRRTPMGERDSVTFLLATDLLSEGVNLQDASVVVHLDLPWNPQRLAQRVGRVRRPGGAVEVWTYLLSPPAPAALLLEQDTRLRRKLERSGRIVGSTFSVFPSLSHAEDIASESSAGAVGALMEQLSRWGTRDARPCADVMIAAAAATDCRGWLAALEDGRLLAGHDEHVTEDVAVVARLCGFAERRPREHHADEVERALGAIATWARRERLGTTCGVASTDGPLRQRISRWLESVSGAIPRHERQAVLSLLTRVRTGLRGSLPLGAERLLANLADANGRDANRRPSLGTALEIMERARPGATSAASEHADIRAVALILIGTLDAKAY